MKKKCIFCGNPATHVCVGCGLLVCIECKGRKGLGNMHEFEAVSE